MTDAHRTLLVPLDGSAFAEKALLPAARHAARVGGTLHLVSAVTPYPIFQPADPAREETPGWFAEEGARARRYLAEAKTRAEALAPGVEVRIHAPTGRPAPALLRVAEEETAELIVMTSRGRGALARAWVGSVADRVMREAPCPVLLLTTDEPELDPKRILVAMDGSETAEEALSEAARLARAWEGSLVLAAVVPRPHSVAVPYLDLSAETERMRMDREEEMREYLERAAEPFRAEGLAVEVTTSRDDEVAPGLLRLRERNHAGVVVVGTQGRGGVARLLLGSVATRVVRDSPVPVFLVPPRAVG